MKADLGPETEPVEGEEAPKPLIAEADVSLEATEKKKEEKKSKEAAAAIETAEEEK